MSHDPLESRPAPANPASSLFEQGESFSDIPFRDWDTFQSETLAILENVTGQMRYPEHHMRMLGNLPRFPEFDTQGVRIGIMLHDAVDHGILEQADPDIRKDVRDHISGWHSEQNEDGKLVFEYGLGLALSAWKWEQAAERSRGDNDKGLEYLQKNDVDMAAGISRSNLRTIARETGADITTVIRQLRAAIGGNRQLLKEGEEFRPEILYRFVPKIVRPEEFLSTIDTLDIEGLAIKTLEVVDNVLNPPPNRPDAIWRDIIEIQTFYAPALELYGFEDLAAYARGIALEQTIFDEEAKANAREQYELSMRHFTKIQDELQSAIGAAIGEREAFEKGEEIEGKTVIPGIAGITVELDNNGRVKMPGSIAKKLLSDDYLEASQVPDGIGFRLLVDWSDSELDRTDEDALASADIDELRRDSGELPWLDEEIAKLLKRTPNFKSWLGENHRLLGIENTIKNPRKSGYQAIHVQMEYIADNGEIVPYEIQIVNKYLHRKEHTYGRATHIFYKQPVVEGTRFETILQHLDDRADTLRQRPNDAELNPNAWADIIELFPELKSPMNRVFGVTRRNGVRSLVPREIAGIGQDIVGGEHRDSFLPPYQVTKEDFLPLVMRLSPEVARNQDFIKALEFADQWHADAKRRDGEALVMETHILPSVVHGLMLLKRTGELWKLDREKELIPTATSWLLHDTVEDTGATLEMIEREFGSNVAGKVGVFTKPQASTDEEREWLYSEQLRDGDLVVTGKLIERAQNHGTDIVQALLGKPIDAARARGYWEKTLRSFGEDMRTGIHAEVARALQEFIDLAFPVQVQP